MPDTNKNEMDFLDSQPRTDSNNSGALYPNNRRTKDSHPNCKGRALVGGLWYWVSGWNNIMPQSDSRYIALSYTEMTQADVDKYINKLPEQAPAQAQAPAETDEVF